MPTPLDKTVAGLRARGVRAGTRVAFAAASTSAGVSVTVACWRLGAVAVPLSPRWTETQRRDALACLGGSLWIDDTPALVGAEASFWGGCVWEDLETDPAAEASIVFTSGSSGRPRGVLHTLANHRASAAGADTVIPFGPEHTWLVSLPLHHVGGLALIGRALLRGGRLAFSAPGEPPAAALARTGATHLSVVPAQLRCLLDEGGGDGLEALLVGGQACPVDWVNRAAARALPLHLTYGSTEMASQVTTTGPGEAAATPTCSGTVLPGRALRVSADGEIHVRGETRFVGYVMPEGRACPFDAEGWFATGDLGRQDEHGRLFVTGRRDTMFISGGENLHPERIERALSERLGGVPCVVVPVPDPEYGRRPVAFVRADGPLPPRDALDLPLERFQWPDRLLPWPSDLPPSLKPDRHLLTRLAVAQSEGRDPRP